MSKRTFSNIPFLGIETVHKPEFFVSPMAVFWPVAIVVVIGLLILITNWF